MIVLSTAATIHRKMVIVFGTTVAILNTAILILGRVAMIRGTEIEIPGAEAFLPGKKGFVYGAGTFRIGVVTGTFVLVLGPIDLLTSRLQTPTNLARPTAGSSPTSMICKVTAYGKASLTAHHDGKPRSHDAKARTSGWLEGFGIFLN